MEHSFKHKNLTIGPNQTVEVALKYLKANGQKCLVVISSKYKLLGTLSDGDIRNHIINNGNVKSKLLKIYNKNPFAIIDTKISQKELRNYFTKFEISIVPVIDKHKKVVDIITRNSFNKKLIINPNIIPILIMAGGKGIRMRPFTDILPKPLIPINGIPVIQILINKFYEKLGSPIFISVNYKDKIMKAYLNDLKDKFDLKFINENKPLGTIGSAKLITHYNFENLIVTNCDVLIDTDIKKTISFHKKNKFDLTIIGVKKKYNLSYGIMKIKNKILTSLIEKPKMELSINGGFYIINKKILEKIPKNRKYDLTDLIRSLLKSKKKIGVYEISERKWSDIGQWDKYKETLSKLR